MKRSKKWVKEKYKEEEQQQQKPREKNIITTLFLT